VNAAYVAGNTLEKIAAIINGTATLSPQNISAVIETESGRRRLVIRDTDGNNCTRTDSGTLFSTLGMASNSTSQTADTIGLKKLLQGLLDQIVDLLNVRDETRFVFAGVDIQTKPAQLNNDIYRPFRPYKMARCIVKSGNARHFPQRQSIFFYKVKRLGKVGWIGARQ
jgi:hypothetical protein